MRNGASARRTTPTSDAAPATWAIAGSAERRWASPSAEAASSVCENTSPQTSWSHSENVSGRSIAATGLTAVASVGFISPSMERPCSGLAAVPTWSR